MPTITLTDKLNQEKFNQMKIIDTDFDAKLEEFLSAEKNIGSVKDLFTNFFNQTNSLKIFLDNFYTTLEKNYENDLLYANTINEVLLLHREIEKLYDTMCENINKISILSVEYEKYFLEVHEYIRKRNQAKLLLEHFENKMNKLITKKQKLKSLKRLESERFLKKLESNDLRFKEALRNYIDISYICFQALSEILKYKQNYINPALSIMVGEEHKFHSTVGKVLEKISNLQNGFDEIDRDKFNSSYISYNPLNYLKTRIPMQNIFKNYSSEEKNIDFYLGNYEQNLNSHIQNNLVPYQTLFTNESKMFAESLRNLSLKVYLPKTLEKSKSTNDVSQSGLSLNNIQEESISQRNEINLEAYNIDNYIEGKKTDNDNHLINNNGNKIIDNTKYNINNINYNVYNNNDEVNYENYENIDNKNNNNLLRNSKVKLIPIKIPSSSGFASKKNENKLFINNNKDSNITNKNLSIFTNNESVNGPSQNTHELRTKDTVESKPSKDSSYLSSSMLSDNYINDENKQMNSIRKTQEKKNKYSQKYLIKYEDYLRNYLKSNLLHDGQRPEKHEAVCEKDMDDLYKSPTNARQKYEPKIITKEKIENYYLDSLTLKQKMSKKEAEAANKIRLKCIPISHFNNDIITTRTALGEKSYKEPSNEGDYVLNKNYNKSYSTMNFPSSSKFEHQYKSKFQQKDGEDYNYIYKYNYNKDNENDENKENFQNADNVNFLNLPMNISNRVTCNRNKKIENLNKDGKQKTHDLAIQAGKKYINDNDEKNKSNQANYSTFLKKNSKENNKYNTRKEIIEIQENLIVDVSESQGDVENNIRYTEQNIKLKLKNNESNIISPIIKNPESSAGKDNLLSKENLKNLDNLNAERNQIEKLIQDNFPKKCSEFKRLECWEEVSLPKQLSESIKKKLLGKPCKNHDKSMDVIESNVSCFSSDFEDKKLKNNLRKDKSNATSLNKDGEKTEKRSVCGKSQFENFYREILSKENNNALIIYDVFNEKNDFNIDFFDDYYSDNDASKPNNININDLNDGGNQDMNKSKNSDDAENNRDVLIRNASYEMKVSELVDKIKEDTIKRSIKMEKNQENM